MMALERLVTLLHGNACSFGHLVAFLQVQRLGINLYGLAVAVVGPGVVLGVQPVAPAQVAPGKVVAGIHFRAALPLEHCVVGLQVVQEIAHIVMRLLAFGASGHGSLEHVYGLQAEGRAVTDRKREGIGIDGVVSAQIGEPELDGGPVPAAVDIL